MAEHVARIEVARPPEEVFRFLANPTNLPLWQPSLREAFREAPDRVRVMGGGLGADGIVAHVRFVADPDRRTLSWATETGTGCAGDLRVEGAADGALVSITIRLGGRAERPDAVTHWTGDAELGLEGALRASLVAVKELCEGATEGVALVSGGTGSHPDQAALRDSRAYGRSATQNPDTV